MNRCKRRIGAMLLAAAVALSSVVGWHVPAAAATPEGAREAAGAVTTTAAVAVTELGDVELEQTKVNETGLTVRIANADAILSGGRADSVTVTANMYYGDKVTQNVTKTIPLESGKTEYSMDFGYFGKFSTVVEYKKADETVSASEAVTVGIVAEQYNLALINGTFPAVLFSLSLWDKTGASCITKDEEGKPVPTIVVFERLQAWNWNELPENVYKLPTTYEGEYDGAFVDWLGARDKMASYVRDLYEMSPNAVFNLYSTDNYIENMMVLLVANRIPESQYHVVLLSDGSGTYVICNRMFENDTDGSKYADMRNDWLELKKKTREAGKFDPGWIKYLGLSYWYQNLQNYAAVAAEDTNVEWWVGRNSDTFKIGNADVLAKIKANSTPKSIASMLSAVQNAGQADGFKKLYHFDSDMFSEAAETGKPVMVILGSRANSVNEPDFKDYAKMVMDYYGDSYEYYYKGHPGSPTALYPSKQADLDELGITDVDSTIPAELILFFFPDIYMCGYSSSTFLSVEADEMACGVFNMTKASGLAQTTFDGSMFDYFASRISANDAVYGSLCKTEGHSYYLLEFNDTKEVDIAIYDASDRTFAYYKNIAESGYEWSGQLMRNAVVEEIASQDYTGNRIKPEVTVKIGDTVLQKGVDYSVSYGNNVLPGQGSVTVRGRGDQYKNFGSVKKYFVINKVDNPLQITCEDTVYGRAVQPAVVNPSLGSLTFEYKTKGAEDTEYSASVPEEPGDYTLRVTSAGTACYKSAEALADFTIKKAAPVIVTLPSAGTVQEGQDLSSASLEGGRADVEGSFSWKDGTVKPTVADSGKTPYKVVFAPADAVHYAEAETETVITVNPAGSPAPGETATPTAAPGETNKPTAAPGETGEPTAAPGGTDKPTPAPGETATPATPPSTAVPAQTPPAATNVPATPPAATVMPPSATVTPPVPAVSLKQGQKITAGKNKYVVKSVSGTVSLKYAGAVNEKSKKITIPNKVTWKGTSYPVTEIAANAFAKNKQLTKVTIGASVTKIGKKAFYNCQKLKKVVIRGKNVKTVGKKAFKGISKKAKFTLPAAKAKAYRKKIKKAGFTIR